ncbi:hypothetical protein GmHk_13G036898 [Glycine max]|nr:hypothetical protein GmHk_13G036898 [Glycine max]
MRTLGPSLASLDQSSWSLLPNVLAGKLRFGRNLRLTLCFSMKRSHFWHTKLKENNSEHRFET